MPPKKKPKKKDFKPVTNSHSPAYRGKPLNISKPITRKKRKPPKTVPKKERDCFFHQGAKKTVCFDLKTASTTAQKKNFENRKRNVTAHGVAFKGRKAKTAPAPKPAPAKRKRGRPPLPPGQKKPPRVPTGKPRGRPKGSKNAPKFPIT